MRKKKLKKKKPNSLDPEKKKRMNWRPNSEKNGERDEELNTESVEKKKKKTEPWRRNEKKKKKSQRSKVAVVSPSMCV